MSFADVSDSTVPRRGVLDPSDPSDLARSPLEIQELIRENGLLGDRLELIGRAAGIGIWEYDFRREQLWISPELAALYGVARDALTWAEFASRLHPDDVVSQLERPTPSFPLGQLNEFLIRVRHADGRYRRIRSRSVTVGHDGAPHRKLGVHIDISEDVLLGLHEDLAEANERLRQFAYLASHDIKAPLNQIRQLTEFATDDLRNASGEEAPALLDMVSERAGRLAGLVDDMLAYATVEASEVSPREIDVARFVHEVVDVVDDRGKTITIDVLCDLRCRVLPSPLGACVRNLVDNACKHHDKPTGTVALTVRVEPHWLVISVVDDGPGISPERRARMFEPCFTSDRTSSTGLGLAHVERTVHKHDAVLDCQTVPGDGATFTLRWPILAG